MSVHDIWIKRVGMENLSEIYGKYLNFFLKNKFWTTNTLKLVIIVVWLTRINFSVVSKTYR